jgi:hypothetical protein
VNVFFQEILEMNTYLCQKIAAATRPTTPTRQHVPTIAKKKEYQSLK